MDLLTIYIPNVRLEYILCILVPFMKTFDGWWFSFVAELMHYFVILLKHRESVQATQMVNSVQHLQSNGKFTFPSTITFENLENDFVISVEVYAVVSFLPFVAYPFIELLFDSAANATRYIISRREIPYQR